MKIGFIGAGRVGRAFGLFLKDHGQTLSGYYSRTPKSASMAARLTDSGYFGTSASLIKNSDIIFITTPDGEIENVAQGVKEQFEANFENLKGKLFIHMSGAHSSDILESVRAIGANVGSLHPIQSIADVDTAVMQLKKTVFSIEGTKTAVDFLKELMCAVETEYFIIDSSQKTLYHMAACVVSNYLVTLVDIGLEIYESIGINRDVGYKALYPLIHGTVENLKHMDTKEALTGPIVRGDTNTVKAHLNAVENLRTKAFYKFLGLYTVAVAKQKPGADTQKLEQVLRLLDEVES